MFGYATQRLLRHLGQVPRFFLHICNSDGFAEDQVGHNFPDVQAAQAAALNEAWSMIASHPRRGDPDAEPFIELEIEDQDHKRLLKLTCREAAGAHRNRHLKRAGSELGLGRLPLSPWHRGPASDECGA